MSTEIGDILLAHARGAIAAHFGVPGAAPAEHAALDEPGATFVTIKLDAGLRGCIGSLEAHRPLREDVRVNALGAAFRDPRFAPLSVREFARTRIEVSLLSPLELLTFSCEDELLALLRPGIDGLVFRYGHHRSTFLPQVWESLPGARDFLEHLKRKAGLPFGFWAPEVQAWRYAVAKWAESDLEATLP
ncbi:MAG TPA: AmmeMemoRadiSam system protein A [Pelomicrobium sp.]|nr:AmmeMemoRadiSam system protein A [Pelomicrobium sp.]